MTDVSPRIDIGIGSVFVRASHLGDQIPVGTIPVYQADRLLYEVMAVRKEGSCRGCCLDGLGLCQGVACGSRGFIFIKVDDIMEEL